MLDLERLQKELAASGKTESLRALADSPEGKKIAKSLDTAAVEKAAKSGDTAALEAILRQVLSTSEGKALASKLQDALGKK